MIKIILVGYMGSGKTTVGQLLSEKMQIPFLDLDREIEKNEQASVSEIFKNKGEIYFRKQEHIYFKQFLVQPGELVLSLGGGTPCYANNHELLNGDNAVSLYLKASIETIVNRLDAEENRPLLAGMSAEEKREFIAKHLFDRSFYYNQARFTISVDNKTPEQIATEISRLLA